MSKLQEAYDLIKDENRWCKGSLARDADGCSVSYNDENATRWCAYGALLKVYENDQVGLCAVIKRLDIVAFKYFDTYASFVNDIKGHKAILKVYEYAIGN